MGRLFGTDGVRGVANTQLTSKLAYSLGYSACLRLTTEEKKPTFLIGMDTRISGDMLFSALTSGILSCGGNVIDVGVIPTPAVALLTRHFRADAGVVISASHNPFAYNGIKFFNAQGLKLADEIEDEIEQLIRNRDAHRANIVGKDVGTMKRVENATEIYEEYLLNKLGIESLEGLKIVLDCANGATFKAAPAIFERLGAEVITIYNNPDGCNINEKCGSTHTTGLVSQVIRSRANIGLAFDGDGDRLIAVDEQGNEFNGDKIMYVCARALKEIGKLKGDTVVLTVMSNMGLKKALKEEGIAVSETTVGDRYVLQRMLEEGYSFGGEQSGHLICTDINSTGDGIASAMLLAKIMKSKGEKLSELGEKMKIYPQILINAKVANEKKYDYEEDAEILAAIRKLDDAYAGNGRVLIRTSGTEPLVRVMIEGEDFPTIKRDAMALAELIQGRLQ